MYLMNFKKTLILFSFFLCSISVWSQTFSISGSVKDTKNEPVAFANILVLLSQDSIAVTGASSDENGKFIIDNIEIGNYILKTSFIGFKDDFKTINIDSNINDVVILLEESIEALNEVQLVFQKPTLRREADRLIFKVENTALSQGNLAEVLRSTPGVLVLDDAIFVKNSTPTVYINDRRVYLSSTELIELLQGTTAANIKSVELITNPPAKYDADSGVVLNIVMSKNLITGYNGSVFSNYTQGVFPKYNAGTSHYFKGEKVNLFVNYGYNNEKENRENIEKVFYPNEDWRTNIDRNIWKETHNLGLNFDYNLSEKSSLGISANAQFLPYFKYITKSETNIDSNTSMFDRFISNNLSRDTRHNVGVDLDYNYNINDKSKLSFNSHYTNYDYLRKQNVNSTYFTDGVIIVDQTAFNTNENQGTNIFTSQLNYGLTINDKATFNTGVKFSNVDTESGILQNDIIDGEEMENTDNTNMFDYSEDVYAAFIDYNYKGEKLSLSGGLRAEQTTISGLSSNNMDSNQDYLEFFPTANIGYKISENVDVFVNYKRSIERPNYSFLNPFVYYLNDNTIVTGNPGLKPKFINNFIIGATINNKFNFYAYLKDYKNNFFQIPLQDNENNLVTYSTINLESTREIGFDFDTYLNITDNWFLSFATSIYNYDDKGIISGSVVKRDKWANYSELTSNLSLLKDKSLTASFSVTYVGENVQGLQINSTSWYSYLIIAKSLFNKKATLSLSFNDLLNRQDYFVTTKFLDQNRTYFDDVDTRYIRLGFRYKFGNTKLSTNERSTEKEELNRLEKKQ
ncbi:MAG: glucosamine-6-phosphate deaminase [Bacteroidetes bacterium]|nr:MAG: glucosamine-6-phosphate deaminase [Bacteroidota bacterium]